MKKIRYLIMGLFLFPLFAKAQSTISLEQGSSKSDYYFSILGFRYDFQRNLSLGIEMQSGNYRYRFIDAREVRNGYTGHMRIFIAGAFNGTENLTLHYFVKAGYRHISAGDQGEQDFNYSFEDGKALTIDPGLLVGMKLSDRWHLFSGFNASMVFQIKPEVVFEQYPSAIVYGGLMYKVNEKWAIYNRLQAGPMSGASGDTEKFFWSASLGLRKSFGNTHLDLIGY